MEIGPLVPGFALLGQKREAAAHTALHWETPRASIGVPPRPEALSIPGPVWDSVDL